MGGVLRTATDFVVDNLTGMYFVDYSLDSAETGGVSDPGFLAQVELFTDWLERLGVESRWQQGRRITDEATCFKVFRMDVLRRFDLQCERFEFCPEVVGKLGRARIPIHEVPIEYEARDVASGKKIPEALTPPT